MEKIKLYTFANMEIGKEIRRTRRDLDITQEQLAKMVSDLPDVKLSQREISDLEKGKGNCTLNKIEAIAKVLNKEWVLR